MTNDRILAAFRQLFERAETLDPQIETSEADVDALLAGLAHLVARHTVAAKERENAAPAFRAKPRTIIDPKLSPFEGAWQITNASDALHVLVIGDTQVAVPPGASYVEADPRDALASHIESGALQVYPPGLYSDAWCDGLSRLAWERRAMAASKVSDALALAECAPHVRVEMKANIKQRLAALAKPAETTQPAHIQATRLRTAKP